MKNYEDFHDDLVDWIDALENQILFNGRENTSDLVKEFFEYAKKKNLLEQSITKLPFENTISQYEEDVYPGDWDIEQSIRHYIRWNALLRV